MGIRYDLKLLDDIELKVAEPQTLIRYLLVNDEKFMGLLFGILEFEREEDRSAAWTLLSRLPLCLHPKS